MKRYVMVLVFMIMSVAAVSAAEPMPGRLNGNWTVEGKGPVSGGVIYLFNRESGPPPQSDRSFIRAPDAIERTDAFGKFSVELPAGSYYISAQKKSSGDFVGPPKDGDLSGVVRNEKGEPIPYLVRAGETTDIGRMKMTTIYRSAPVKIVDGMTAISGVVKADDGTPLANERVMVYDNPEIKGIPAFVAQNTGTDGRYVVQVEREGIYYVTVRSVNSGGRPINGELVGAYGGEIAQPVQVQKLKVTGGIDIQVARFIDKRPANYDK